MGPVLVEAEDVRAGLSAGKLTVAGGDAGTDHDNGEPKGVPGMESLGKERKREGAGRKKEDPDPEWPVTEPVDRGVTIAELPLMRILNFSAVFH
jgi:hypothetical protein